MSLALSSFPIMLKEKSYQAEMLKSSPARGFFPALLPGPHHYVDLFPRTHGLLDPLKSLGRLVSDTRASLPHSLHAGAPFRSPALHERMMCASGIPYLTQMLPGHTVYSKPENPSVVVTENAGGPLSSDFCSPSSERCPSASSSVKTPPKEDLFRLHCADLSPEKNPTSYNFSEDDLFMVLYGYYGRHERSVGHAISGMVLPENSGEFTFTVV